MMVAVALIIEFITFVSHEQCKHEHNVDVNACYHRVKCKSFRNKATLCVISDKDVFCCSSRDVNICR